MKWKLTRAAIAGAIALSAVTAFAQLTDSGDKYDLN